MHLQKSAIDQEAAEWLEDNVGDMVKADAGQLRTAKESLQKSLQAATTENEALLNLRLRGQVDDETYDRKRLEIADRQTTLRLKLEERQLSEDDLLSRLQQILRFSLTAPFVFAKASPVQRRQIAEAVASNWRVMGREPLYLAKDPFSILASARSRPKWWSTCVHLRTWLFESTDFYLPDLKIETEHGASMMEQRKTA
jgi:hypothetical protein